MDLNISKEVDMSKEKLQESVENYCSTTIKMTSKSDYMVAKSK